MKYQYTNKNHFKYGYDLSDPFKKRQNSIQVFNFEYGQVENKDLVWRQSNALAAQKIRNNFVGPICVLFSGGTDSEVCIRSFLEAQIPISIATMRFDNNLNAHDLEHAKRFAEKLKIEIKYFDLNILDFWKSKKMLEIVDSISCVSPILASHLWLAEQVSGVPVLAQGEPHLKKTIPKNYSPGISPYLPSDWYLVESERLCSLYQYFIELNIPAVPGFFQYLPEQIYSFCYKNPILKDLVENKVVGKLGTRTSKNKMIHFFYPEIELRTKFTGFEKIENHHDLLRKSLAERFPYNDNYKNISFPDLKKMLS